LGSLDEQDIAPQYTCECFLRESRMFKFRVKPLGILVFFDLKQDIDKARMMESLAK